MKVKLTFTDNEIDFNALPFHKVIFHTQECTSLDDWAFAVWDLLGPFPTQRRRILEHVYHEVSGLNAEHIVDALEYQLVQPLLEALTKEMHTKGYQEYLGYEKQRKS